MCVCVFLGNSLSTTSGSISSGNFRDSKSQSHNFAFGRVRIPERFGLRRTKGQARIMWTKNFLVKCFRSLNRMKFIPGVRTLPHAFIFIIIIGKDVLIKILSEIFSKLMMTNSSMLLPALM